ncbi:hypothetical protein QBC47DRAFT_426538 [Echria macrotheca]|uniref:F-box domain-containing protein n=1 Tax=Echria macrotheca TaxID=438768 RepID=A0AAJ0B1F4_9PEZI|nr:hypothetical protein QBC47DRAFT_426538 [Echria macrotheca]
MDTLFGAPEVLVLIFIKCSRFRDVLALSATCKHLDAVWRSNSTSIIWPIAQVDFRGFNQALVAVCSYGETKANVHSRALISGHIQKPNLQDLKDVLSLQHLVLCVEQMYTRWELRRVLDGPGEDADIPEDERTRMRDRFHQAMYRVLTCGAALARVYLEPFFLAAAEGPPGFLRRMNDLSWDRCGLPGHFTDDDVDYLRRFPAYDIEAADQRTWEPVFGHLANWLMADIETTPTAPVPPPGWRWLRGGASAPSFPLDKLEILQDITSIVAAHEITLDRYFQRYLYSPGDEDLCEEDRIPPPFPGAVRKIPAVMFGIFRPEEISVPDRVADASRCYLVTRPLPPKKKDKKDVPQSCDILDSSGGTEAAAAAPSPWAADVTKVLDLLDQRPRRGGPAWQWPLPPPALRFFQFLLRKNFNLVFNERLFDRDINQLDFYFNALMHE